jgi:dTDP-4-amino-4,6-dideoxygalactose transaminase
MTNPKIDMVDLRGQYLRIKPEVDAAIQRVLHATAFIQGPEVKEFAAALQAWTHAGHVIPCANGTDALQIAMMALELKPGDEVILPVHTYVATAEVIALLGLRPVFVDVCPDTFNLDVTAIEKSITPKTKAIVPVHLYGQCADMEPLLAIAQKHNLFVIEDAAQSLGSVYTFANGVSRQAGTIGTIGATSFYPSKNLGCYGDGGALFTNDENLADKIRVIANHGQKVRYYHDVIGVNSRLDTIQAAILNVKLKYLAEYNERRNAVAAFYDACLTGVGDLQLPVRARNATHVFHQYTIKTDRRDGLRAHLEQRGIPTMIYYPVPLHLQKAYRQPGVGPGAFPVSERLSATVLSLPIHTEMNEEQLTYICGAVNYFYS